MRTPKRSESIKSNRASLLKKSDSKSLIGEPGADSKYVQSSEDLVEVRENLILKIKRVMIKN